MIKTILVPVDGSQPSIKAAELASDLAAKYDAEIVLLHVLLRGHMAEGLRKALEVEVSSKAAGFENLVNIPQEIMARVGDKKDRQLTLEQLEFIGNRVLASVAALCKEKGVTKVKQRVEEGEPAKTILQAAEDTKADMIVMGNRGLSNLQGILVGSVSHKVSYLAECTCVTVR